jgi:ribosomal protein S18 acetylase RimI-like enzyme
MNGTQAITGNESVGGIPQKENIQITFATLDDVSALVDLHYRCFTKKDHIALRFGKPFIIATYKWFVTSPDTYVVIARLDARLVGFQSVADRPYDAPMLRASWPQALLGLLLHPWLAFDPDLLRRLWRLLFRRDQDVLDTQVGTLAFIGVDPQVQGRGVGKALVRRALQACHERGMKAVITGVMRQNARSLAMLKGAGFAEVLELGTKRFIHLRLEFNQDGTIADKISESIS